MNPPNGYGSRADERPAISKSCRRDASAAGERQLGVLVERLLRRVEEGGSEAERDRPTDHHQVQVENVAH